MRDINELKRRVELRRQQLVAYVEKANREILAREYEIRGLESALAWLEVGDFDGEVVDQIMVPNEQTTNDQGNGSIVSSSKPVVSNE